MPVLDLKRNPNFGDTLTSDYRMVVRRNLSNQVNTIKSFYWATTDTFRFTISGLSYDDKEAIITFLLVNAGEEITLIDYNSIAWTGVTVEDPKTEEIGPTGQCMFQITLALEGSFKTPNDPFANQPIEEQRPNDQFNTGNKPVGPVGTPVRTKPYIVSVTSISVNEVEIVGSFPINANTINPSAFGVFNLRGDNAFTYGVSATQIDTYTIRIQFS